MDPFRTHLHDNIGKRWNALVKANLDLVALGTVRITFAASPDGKIIKVQILSNTSNETFATFCLQAVMETKIPPIPPPLLREGRFEDELSFSMLADLPKTPSEIYRGQAMDVIKHAVLPEWGKHKDKMDSGTLTFHYRVYPNGRIADLKITSTTGNRFLEEISLRCMQGVKLPRVPPGVLGDEPWLEMETQMKPQVNG